MGDESKFNNAAAIQGHPAAVIFSAELAKRLSTREIRLPPTNIGVRRIRPSSRLVQSAMKGAGLDNRVKKEAVVYKTVDPETGLERRMTNEEKKEVKNQRREELKQARKLQKQKLREEREKEEDEKKVSKRKLTAADNAAWWLQKNKEEGSRYFSFNINKAALEEELADLKGERDGVPPVVLASSAARLCFGQQVSSMRLPKSVVVNDDLAKDWARQLKQSMLPAERVRGQEDLRKMVYDLIPESWIRGRPESLGCVNAVSEKDEVAGVQEEHSWAQCIIRPPSPFDYDLAAVLQVLHQGTNLHVTCGAKFGCDFLLYDSPRTESHAFAGLRVVAWKSNQDNDASSSQCPLLTPYDMTGYVRTLNTAGKLALIATVRKQKLKDNDDEQWDVAFVDLSLIKIEQTNSRRKKKND